MPTIPVVQPKRQLDFILLHPADRWQVVETRIRDEACDHRAILSALALRGGVEPPKSVPPLGAEQADETRGISPAAVLAVPLAVPSVRGDDDQTEELLAVWADLDAAARADVLAVARGLRGVLAASVTIRS